MVTTIHKGNGNGHGHWIVKLRNHVMYREVSKQEARKQKQRIDDHIRIFVEQSGLQTALQDGGLAWERARKAIGR